MPATALANTIIVTKLSASGNFLFRVQTPQGSVRYELSLLSADMATAAALGSGASATFTYGQDAQRNDFETSYNFETF